MSPDAPSLPLQPETREAVVKEYAKHSPDCAGWQANCLDFRLCNCGAAPSLPPVEAHWSVEVRRNGENLVTIETNSLSGKPEFSDEEADTIRDAARHLQSFIDEAIPHPQTWQPMSTAPKDGTHIDLWAFGRRWADAYWNQLRAEWCGTADNGQYLHPRDVTSVEAQLRRLVENWRKLAEQEASDQYDDGMHRAFERSAAELEAVIDAIASPPHREETTEKS